MLEEARGAATENAAQAAESEPETEAEAESELEPEPRSEPEPEAEPEPEPEAEPQPELEPEPEPEAESDPAPAFEAESDPGPVYELEFVPAPLPRSEPEDEIPLEYRLPATTAGRHFEPWRPGPGGIVIRVVAYAAAVSWPFLGTLFTYVTLNDSGEVSNVCSDNGCVELGTEFASRALPWLFPTSAASALVVLGVSKAVRAAREREREYVLEPEDEQPPVPRIVLAAMFAGVCALAFVVGVLRGVMINRLGY